MASVQRRCAFVLHCLAAEDCYCGMLKGLSEDGLQTKRFGADRLQQQTCENWSGECLDGCRLAQK